MTDPDRLRPLCFVIMPFGVRPDASGRMLDFDAVYREVLAPAIEAADLEPIRADQEEVGGLIHKPMYERLILCDYAVADLTTANPNVFYELGMRHGIRPRTTVVVFAQSEARLPFDVAPLRGMPYAVDESGAPADPEAFTNALADRLRAAAQRPADDSPLFQVLDGYRAPDVDRLKTDLFRERVAYAQDMKDRLAQARREGPDAVAGVEEQVRAGAVEPEAGVLVDLLLSYRAVKAWDRMIGLYDALPEALKRTVLVREQFAFALNRAGQGERAEAVLQDLLADRGASSETYGLLGRVYKDRWEAARTSGNAFLAEGVLNQAMDAYLAGFEADWRDAYPGINAVTLMELREPPDPRRTELVPVVTYAVKRRLAGGAPDYWDHATLLELAVLADDPDQARSALVACLAAVREPWEPETTARNLGLIRDARVARGQDTGWLQQVLDALSSAASPA